MYCEAQSSAADCDKASIEILDAMGVGFCTWVRVTPVSIDAGMCSFGAPAWSCLHAMGEDTCGGLDLACDPPRQVYYDAAASSLTEGDFCQLPEQYPNLELCDCSADCSPECLCACELDPATTG